MALHVRIVSLRPIFVNKDMKLESLFDEVEGARYKLDAIMHEILINGSHLAKLALNSDLKVKSRDQRLKDFKKFAKENTGVSIFSDSVGTIPNTDEIIFCGVFYAVGPKNAAKAQKIADRQARLYDRAAEIVKKYDLPSTPI